MHELGITRSVVAICSERANGAAVRRVTLEIGKLSAVLPESIRFCFDICAKGTPLDGAMLMIENVGNLVCPALFDLGEHAKVVILSVTEGEDKPVKYPHMFRASQAMLVNKIDLLPHLRFDIERCIGYALQVNPGIEVFRV